MTGKSKCKILKEIRRQIAAQNDIEYVTSECKFQGNCSGTCPKCEAEVRYLEEQLRKRQRAGLQVAVAGIAAALVVTSAGCSFQTTAGDPLPLPTDPTSQSSTIAGLMGIPAVESSTTQPTESTEPTEDPPLMGEPLPPEIDGEMVADEGE